MARKIATSGKAAGNDRLKVFISYSRRDAAAANAIVAALTERGFDVTIDTRDLPFGEKWQAELAEFIRLSDTVIWLVSEASIRSDWVNWELDIVAKRNKRLVPVMVGLVKSAELPRELGEIHILPPDRVFDLARDLDTLVQVLETDRAWLKQASRLQDRAHEWLSKSRASALLLSRSVLSDAERWKDRRPAKAPAPAPEVMDLLLASRQSAARRQRWVVGGSIAFSVAALAAAGYAMALRSWGAANESRALAQERLAIVERDRATVQRNLALATNSRILARDSELALAERDPVKALLIALEALPAAQSERPHVWQAERAAYAALFQLGHLSTLQAPRGWADWQATFSADGAVIFGESEFSDRLNSARLWRARTGEEIATFEGLQDGPRPAVIDATRQRLLINPAPGKGDSGIFELASLAFIPVAVPGTRIVLANFSQNGERLLTAHDDGKARLWKAATGALLAVFDAGNSDPVRLHLSFDGRRVSIWPSETETLIYEDTEVLHCRLKFQENEAPTELAFAVGGTRLVTLREHIPLFKIVGSITATVWDLERCTPQVVEADIGKNRIASMKVLSPGDRLVLSTMYTARLSAPPDPGVVVVWDIAAGQTVQRFDGVYGHVVSGDSVVMLMQDPASKKRVLVADLDGRRVALQSEGSDPRLENITINAQGTRIAARWNQPDSYRLWDAVTGRQLAKLDALPLSFSVNGKLLFAAPGADGKSQLWNTENGSLISIIDTGGGSPVGAAFSADDNLIAIPASGGTRHVVAIADTPRKLLLGENIGEADFTTDGAHVVGRSSDGAERAWDAQTGAGLTLSDEELQRLHAQASRRPSDDELNKSFEERVRLPPTGSANLMNQQKPQRPSPDADMDQASGQAIAGREVRRLQEEQQLQNSQHGVKDLAFLVRLEDMLERWLWLVGNDGRVKLVRAEETLNTPLRVMNGLSNGSAHWPIPESHQLLWKFQLEDVAFSPDGASILTIAQANDADTTMRLWRKDKDRPVAERPIEEDRLVVGVRFDPTGRRIFVAYDDGTMQVLSADRLEEVVRLQLGGTAPTFFGISRDGTRLMTETDGRFLLWRIEPSVEALVTEARRVLPRCLAVAERISLQLDPEPPRWCITGATLENAADTMMWKPKRPYHKPVWRDWLAAINRGEKPSLPGSE